MSELGYEVWKDILGRENKACQGSETKSASRAPGAVMAFRGKEVGVRMRRTRAMSCWALHSECDSQQDTVLSERSLFCVFFFST